jgi:large subunit ribosomal protein L4
MPKVAVYNIKGEQAGSQELSDDVFAATGGKTLVHQVYLALEANAREPWAHTKDRSEVRGGGRKPWKQKGTGRARHGSNRSPIWTGGGVTFGPLSERNFKQKINKKMNKKAVKLCLTGKVTEEKLVVLENVPATGKTKDMAALRKMLPGDGKTTLIVVEEVDDTAALALRNIPRVHMQRAHDVNVVDLLHHQYIIVTKSGVETLESRLA